MGHITLDSEDVSQIPVVGLCPEVFIGPGINELAGNQHLIPGPPDATFQNVRDSQLFCYDPQGFGGFLVKHNRSPGDHFKTTDFCQVSHNIIGHPITEVFIVFAVTEINEWKYGDRFFTQFRFHHLAGFLIRGFRQGCTFLGHSIDLYRVIDAL
ncbi:hypothetical protein ES703_98514 [subsurface metagenome]